MIRAALARFYRALLPYPASGAGVPGLAAHRKPYKVARTDLTRRARRLLAERERASTLNALRAGNAAGHKATLPPRAEVVATVSARQAIIRGE